MTRGEVGQLQELRERMIRMEGQADHRASEQAEMKAKIDKMEADIQSIKDILTQAQGAKWAILAMAGVSGFLAAKGGALFQFLLSK